MHMNSMHYSLAALALCLAGGSLTEAQAQTITQRDTVVVVAGDWYDNDPKPAQASAQKPQAAAAPADPNALKTRAVSGTMLDEVYEISGQVVTNAVDAARSQDAFLQSLPEGFAPRTGALTNKKAVLVSGVNDYRANRIPSAMRRQLDQCKQLEQTIDDVCLTDMGWWAVVHDGTRVDGEIPTSCDETVDSLVSLGHKIVSIAISDDGDWALLTDKTAAASNPWDLKAIQKARELYGTPTSVAISNTGCAVACPRGTYLYNVPEAVYSRLQDKRGMPSVVRFTDSGTYIAVDGKGFSSLYM